MTRLCGADGCRDGWVAITEDLETGAFLHQLEDPLVWNGHTDRT